MPSPQPLSARWIGDRPIRMVLAPFPTMLFVAALCADLAYWKTADPMWTTVSSWLLLLGLIAASGALLMELTGFFRAPKFPRRPRPPVRMLGNALAVLLSVVNFVFHVRDGYSAVVPVGPLLSTAVVLILLLTGLAGFIDRRRAEASLARGEEV